MTNKDIIIKVIANDKNRLTEEECDFIFANYRKAEVHESNDWYTVIREGNDVKYGRFNIDPVKMLRRGQTFSEFYGNGIVD